MFEFTRNFYSPEEEGSESSFTPGQVIILEQTVSTSSKHPSDTPHGEIIKDHTVVPDKLLIEFNGTEYIVEKKTFHDSGALLPIDVTYYGEMVGNKCSFNTYPFYIEVSDPSWILYTESKGTYTISAKIPEEKSAPKVLSFPKGRTIVSELSRINKAFGTISKKKTIIGQLSDIADAAEAGKIGGGSGLFIVNTKMNMVPGQQPVYENASKNASEIVDAANNNRLPVLFVYFEANDVTMTALYSEPVYSDGLLESAKFVSIDGKSTLFVGVDNTIELVNTSAQ